MATIHLSLSAMFLLHVSVERLLGESLQLNRLAVIAIILIVVFLSDRRWEDSWFGARPVALREEELSRAKAVAWGFLLGSWVLMVVIAVSLYSN